VSDVIYVIDKKGLILHKVMFSLKKLNYSLDFKSSQLSFIFEFLFQVGHFN